ncbi:MAG: hypothetical protein G5663_06560 [Serratia symbiotica]|nr:hypothetical protein [Serratia symbiotica]
MHVLSLDIATADPRSMQVAIAALLHRCMACGSRTGHRTGNCLPSTCAPKRNAVYTAFKAAMRDAREQDD